MKFILEVDLAQGELVVDPTAELGRILRYWAGNLKHYELGGEVSEVVYDSAYGPVGTWRTEES